MQVQNIAIEKITVTSNPRKQFNRETIETLAATIKKQGLLQPIVVTELPTGDFNLVAGERRFRAFKHLGREDIPGIVVQGDESQIPAMQLVENIAREDLSPLDEAHAIETVYEAQFNGAAHTNDELRAWAETLGIGVRKVRYALNLAQASDYVQAFGRPFSVYTKKRGEDGTVLIGEDGKPVMHRNERQPLDAVALRTLVKLNRALRKHDQLKKKENGAHKEIAEKNVVRLGEKTSLEGWSAKKLDQEAKRLVDKIQSSQTEKTALTAVSPVPKMTSDKLPSLSALTLANLPTEQKEEVAKMMVAFLTNAGFSKVEIKL